MPIQPTRSLTRPAARPVAASTDWGVALPVGRPVAPGAPRQAVDPNGGRHLTWSPEPQRDIRADQTNQAGLNGRNLRYNVSGDAYVSVPYLSATLIDRTPETPLDLWAIGSYTFDVKSGRVDIEEAQLNGAVRGILADQKITAVRNVAISLQDDNRIAVKATAKLGPLPLPVSLRMRVTPTSQTSMNIQPESIKVLGLPIAWAVRMFGIDVPKLAGLPANGPVAKGQHGSYDIDLAKVDLFRGRITGFGIAQGRAAIVLGDAPDPAVVPSRRRNVANYAEVTAKGEVILDAGIIRNAKVVIIDNTPQDPYSLNRWDKEGYARFEYGQVVLPEDQLVKKFAGAGGAGFYMDSVKLVGTDLVIVGQKEVLGLPVPVSFKVRFGATQGGELLLTPHDVKVAGLGFGQSQIVAAMKAMPGMRQVGSSFVLDLRSTASLEMPPIRRVTSERGRVVLHTN